MTALLACLALVVLVLAAVALALHILRLLDRPNSPTGRADNGPTGRAEPDRRHGWCEICGDELWGDDLHEVIDGSVDGDGALSALMIAGGGGGTAMAAEYCATHCPGHCRTPHVA